MSREIKFRVWDKDFREWVIGNYVAVQLSNSNVFEIISAVNWVVQEYTGLKDKNGKEIYEGDIVKTNNKMYVYGKWEEEFEVRRDRLVIGEYGEVVDCWAISDEPLSNLAEGCMVIGNVYENGDLVKK